jgi:DNA-directed RNA polymerase specialized sigma24 family protein
MAIPLPIGGRRNRNKASTPPSADGAPQQALAEALLGLSPDHRSALVETYFRRRSVREAAMSLGIPPDVVKTRVYHAMRALNLALSEAGISPAA